MHTPPACAIHIRICPATTIYKKEPVRLDWFFLHGAAGQIRTADLILTKDALYLLSYSSKVYAPHNERHIVATKKGLEPSTSGVTGRRSNRLNYLAIARLIYQIKADLSIPFSKKFLFLCGASTDWKPRTEGRQRSRRSLRDRGEGTHKGRQALRQAAGASLFFQSSAASRRSGSPAIRPIGAGPRVEYWAPELARTREGSPAAAL